MHQLLTWASVVSGFAAAVLWWLSVQSFYAQSRFTGGWPPPIKPGDSDLSYVLPDDVIIVNHNRRVALTNAWAAGLSGLAVLLQALSQLLALAPSA